MNDDLISREALKDDFDRIGFNDYDDYERALRIIDDAPTVEITEEQAIDKLHETGWMQAHDKEMTDRPKGKWVEGKNGNIKCNKCGCEIRYFYLIGNKYDFPKFCCDCGTEMEVDDEQ